MIIKFKIFEVLKKIQSIDKSKCFWKIKTKDLETSLYKLDAPDNLIKMYLRNDNLREQEYVYISPFYSKDYGSWNEFDTYGKTHYENNGLVYKGKIKITEEDIENMKIKKEGKKFNL